MSDGLNIAVVGATGNVGREILSVLHDRRFPVKNIVALASARSKGASVTFGDQFLSAQDLATFDFSSTDIALFSPGASVSEEYAPKAASEGCVVIDNTSFFRVDPDIPLVVPEVNPEAIAGYTRKGIISNPNCSTAQMLVPLKPLHDKYTIKRIIVSTYQSVSGAGKDAMNELYNQSKSYFEGIAKGQNPQRSFTKEIAFNCIPHIDVFMEDGRTKEEWKMEVETKKILGESIEICATCVRVPVFIGHAESVNVQFERKPDGIEAVRELLEEADGVQVIDSREDGGYITQRDCPRTFPVYISRLREDRTAPNSINMWNVADNIYGKGAALNAVQIAEILHRDYLQK